MASDATGYLYDERFLQHDTGRYELQLPAGGTLEPVEHWSAARITARAHQLVAGSGLLDRLTPLAARAATEEDIALYHTGAYIKRVRATCEAGGGEASSLPGESAPVGPQSYEIALLAAGSAMAAVDAVVTGEVENAFVLCRPPGHHAMADDAMGFCIFNNVVIAARHAQRTHGLRRILVLDWDVHDGNGTQAAFYDDPDVLFISLHQENWYPLDWGKAEDVGTGEARGRTVNVPLPAGTGDLGYAVVFERIIAPVAREFKPELILVSAGQDPSMMDPLGRMLVSMDGFRGMTTTIRDLATEICDGRLVVLQEGGYSLPYTPFCVLAVVEGLVGEQTSIPDPNARTSELVRAHETYDESQEAAIERVLGIQREFWSL